MFLNILVAVDGSEHAAQALRTAAQLAQEEHARLTVITAVPSAPALAQMSAAGVALTEVADLLGEAGKHIRAQVDALPRDISVQSIVVRGQPGYGMAFVGADKTTPGAMNAPRTVFPWIVTRSTSSAATAL